VKCYTRELVCPPYPALRTFFVNIFSVGAIIVKRMKLIFVSAGIACLSCLQLCADEATVIEFFKTRGDSVTVDNHGHAVRLMARGAPPLSVQQLQLIGELIHLTDVGINMSPANDSQWGFLARLPDLKRLKIWHGHHFRSLSAFNGLPVEELTIGGCMGLIRLHESEPERAQHIITTLNDLPNLKKLVLYHSPLAPDDAHLEHLVKSFPAVTSLRLDFISPGSGKSRITARGLARLQHLPLTKLTIENADTFSQEDLAVLATLGTLKQLEVYTAKGSKTSEGEYRALLLPFQMLRPEVKVSYVNR
jgi:hypothetical protein